MKAAAALVLVALLAGCGGGGRHAATQPRPTPAEQLQRYLDTMHARAQRFDVLGGTLATAMHAVDVKRPDATWARAARKLAATANGYERLAAELDSVRPPARLGSAHRTLTRSVREYGAYIRGLERGLRGRRISELAAAATRADVVAIAQERVTWVTAVKSYAKRVNVVLPAWLAPSPAA